jgi:hypothetical protein
VAKDDDDDWIDITEAADPAEVAAATGKAHVVAAARAEPPSGDWGQQLMESHEVPDEIRDQIHAALSKTERLIWFDRPRMDILMHQARRYALSGLLIAVPVGLGLIVGSYFMMTNLNVAAGILVLIVGLILAAFGVFAGFAPASQRKKGPTRACFALTNRRLLIHRGLGSQSRYSGGESVTVVNTGALGISSYSGLDLTRMQRLELKRFPGAGNLVFGRNLYDEPAGGDIWAISDVHKVEKLIREQLVHRIIDKLLRGELLSKVDKGSQADSKAESDAEVVVSDSNIKDYVSGGSKDQEDPNVKAVAGGLAGAPGYDPNKHTAEVREMLDYELTDGEEVLWAGEPDGRTQGRGMIGSLTGSAERKEPDYDLYALTNRRVLLWQTRSSLEAKSLFGSNEVRGPLSYYTPHLLSASLEEDKRIKEGGGSIIFKQVKRVIETQDKKGKFSRRVEMHYFGLLRIRRHRAVARLLYEKLIAPCRAL